MIRTPPAPSARADSMNGKPITSSTAARITRAKAGEQADQRPGDERDRDGHRSDLKRDLGAVDDPRERVAAEVVRAEGVRPARPLQPVGDGVVRVVRPNEAPAERGQDA